MPACPPTDSPTHLPAACLKSSLEVSNGTRIESIVYGTEGTSSLQALASGNLAPPSGISACAYKTIGAVPLPVNDCLVKAHAWLLYMSWSISFIRSYPSVWGRWVRYGWVRSEILIHLLMFAAEPGRLCSFYLASSKYIDLAGRMGSKDMYLEMFVTADAGDAGANIVASSITVEATTTSVGIFLTTLAYFACSCESGFTRVSLVLFSLLRCPRLLTVGHRGLCLRHGSGGYRPGHLLY